VNVDGSRRGEPPVLLEPSPHTFLRVAGTMFRAICRIYRVLPEPFSLTLDQVAYFYDGIRPELKELTKPTTK
jgi:hypothetical protein